MMYLSAPWDLIQATTMLPNPELGNLVNNQIEVQARNSMNNTLYTYIKSNDREKLVYDIRLTRAKSLELETFIDYYIAQEYRLIDYDDVSYRVFLTNNPFEFTRQYFNNETVVRLEFEGFKI